jgi:hypothetical protein
MGERDIDQTGGHKNFRFAKKNPRVDATRGFLVEVVRAGVVYFNTMAVNG